MAQRDLFAGMKMRPTSNAQQITQSINQSKQSVSNSAKYMPASTSMVPQYSVLRQTLAIIEKNIKDGLIEDSDSYVTTNTEEGLRKLRDDILEVGAFAWDTEFDSLEHGYMDATLICVSIHNPKDDTDHFIPFKHCDTQKNLLPNQVTYEQFRNILGCIFESPDIKKMSHQYAACDNIVLRNNTGIKVRGTYWDSLLFVNLIDENRNKGNSLKQLYTEWVLKQEGKEASYDDLFKGISFAFVPLHIARIYACKDSKMTWEVCHEEMKMTSGPDYAKAVKHFVTTEAPQIDITADMTYRGVAINMDITRSLRKEYEELQKECLERMNKFVIQVTGSTINFSSTQQLSHLIYDVLRCPTVDKSKKCPEGTKGTGDEIIEKLANANPHIPIFQDIRIYRSTTKLLGTYLVGIPDSINKKTGKVHGKWLSFGAKTSRYSSREPNLQNIPSHKNEVTGKDDSRVRQMFTAGPGRVYLSSDYSLRKVG